MAPLEMLLPLRVDSGLSRPAETGQKRPLISWQSTAEKALWKQLLTRSPIFGGMYALLISHKHSFLLLTRQFNRASSDQSLYP